MSDTEANVWRGPYESRAAFEAFQDESIGRLVDYALREPLLTSIPEQLEVQLWEMGKYLPAAILGLGRHNPDVTELRVFGEKAAEERRKNPNRFKTGSWINPGPTILEGQAAYERMVNSWHEVDDLPHQHRFSVKSVRETPHELEIAHSGKQCLLLGNWVMHMDGHMLPCGESVVIPDTSRDASINDVDWSYAYAAATDGWGPQGIRYVTTPIREKDNSELLEEGISLLAGEVALEATRNYGKVGLYQQLLWSGTRQLLAGLSPGPNVQLS